MTSILLLMKGFPTGSSGIFSTVVVVVCINLWFWSAAFGIPVGSESSYVATTWSHSPWGKYSIGGVFLVNPVISCGYTCHHSRVCLRTLVWTETCICFQAKKVFAAALLCDYGICSEQIFLLWGLPAHSLCHLHLFSLIFIYLFIYSYLSILWLSSSLNQHCKTSYWFQWVCSQDLIFIHFSHLELQSLSLSIFLLPLCLSAFMSSASPFAKIFLMLFWTKATNLWWILCFSSLVSKHM